MGIHRLLNLGLKTPMPEEFVRVSFNGSVFIRVKSKGVESSAMLTPGQALELMEPIVEFLKAKRDRARQRAAANKARKKAAANAA